MLRDLILVVIARSGETEKGVSPLAVRQSDAKIGQFVAPWWVKNARKVTFAIAPAENCMKNQPSHLGTTKISRLLLEYSVPAIIGTLITSLYNIIDSICIGHGVGSMALAGMALTFPIMNLSGAFGMLIGSGGTALVSIRLGENKKEEAEKILANSLLLSLAIGIPFTFLSLYFLEEILVAFGGSQHSIPYAKEFLEVILAGTLISTLFYGFNNLLRASGHPRKAMVTMIISALINSILAPLFIFGFHWGIRGAAAATLIAQTAGAVWVMCHFWNPKNYLHFKWSQFQPQKKIIAGIVTLGLSPFLVQAAASLVNATTNHTLELYGGDMAVGAFGIISRILTLIVMVVMGLNQGLQPIVGYNYGAKQFSRVRRALSLGIGVAVAITSTGFVAAHLFPSGLTAIFTSDPLLKQYAANALKLGTLIYPIVGFQIITSNFFLSIGKPRKAIFLSLSRQILFLIPAILLLPQWFGVNGVWLAMALSDLLAAFTAAMVLGFQLRGFRQRMQQKRTVRNAEPSGAIDPMGGLY